MGYGSTVAVEDAEAQFEEDFSSAIAEHAAPLVAANDASRKSAIERVTTALSAQAGDDPTADRLTPSRPVPRQQARAIALELRPAARAAAQAL